MTNRSSSFDTNRMLTISFFVLYFWMDKSLTTKWIIRIYWYIDCATHGHSIYSLSPSIYYFWLVEWCEKLAIYPNKSYFDLKIKQLLKTIRRTCKFNSTANLISMATCTIWFDTKLFTLQWTFKEMACYISYIHKQQSEWKSIAFNNKWSLNTYSRTPIIRQLGWLTCI